MDPSYRAWMRMLRYLGYSELTRKSEGKPPRAESYQAMSNIRALILVRVQRLLKGLCDATSGQAGDITYSDTPSRRI